MAAIGCVAAGAVLGCAKLTGVDDYAVSNEEPARREAIAAFLGVETCRNCIEDACQLEVDACTADPECSTPAACMARCQSRNEQAGDPACVIMECPGASLPTNEALLELSACASNACRDPCRIGSSWACSGKYDWPRVPAKPFTAAYQFGIFDSLERFGGQTIRLCDRRSPFPTCEGNHLLAVATTDADGLVEMLVPPRTSVSGGPALPKTYIYVAPTDEAPTSTGVRPATLAHHLEGAANIAPWADPMHVNVLGYGTPSGSTARFVYGTVIDCRGSRLFAGAGLRLEWPHATPKFYWDLNTNVATYDQTHLSGVFSTIIGWAADPLAQTMDVPAGFQRLEFVDVASGDVRASYELPLPAEGSVGVLVGPPTSSE